MRDPVQVAKEIRDELKKVVIKRSQYSVQVHSYKIKCTVHGIDFEKAKKIILDVYHKENHFWLCVSVNNHWLPMPPLNNETLDEII